MGHCENLINNINVKKFKEVTGDKSICNEFFLIKNPDVRVLDYRTKFNSKAYHTNLPVCILSGHSKWGVDEVGWKYQENIFIGKSGIPDEHSWLLNNQFEGIMLSGMNLQHNSTSVFARFITEHPVD